MQKQKQKPLLIKDHQYVKNDSCFSNSINQSFVSQNTIIISVKAITYT